MVSLGMPYASRICSIFPLWMESKALVKSWDSCPHAGSAYLQVSISVPFFFGSHQHHLFCLCISLGESLSLSCYQLVSLCVFSVWQASSNSSGSRLIPSSNSSGSRLIPSSNSSGSRLILIICLNFWDEAWWFLSLRVFRLLSSSLLLFPQYFSRYVLWPSSGVCCLNMRWTLMIFIIKADMSSDLLQVFGLLSSSLLLFPQRFGRYVLRPSSGVCCLNMRRSLMIFIIKGFWTIVFIFIVISTIFQPICPLAFFRCLLSKYETKLDDFYH